MDKRIRVIVGHFGSGKTEFAVNYALFLLNKGLKIALVDLDIANPYFRSREKQAFLNEKGIKVYSNSFGYDITADLPAIGAVAKGPLENKEITTIVDLGGDNSGARILIQFENYINKDTASIYCVINKNRPETGNLQGALKHIRSIESEIGLRITGIINNTHMLRETTVDHIIKGNSFAKEISKEIGVPIIYNTCQEDLLGELEERLKKENIEDFPIFPMKLYMRETWLDR